MQTQLELNNTWFIWWFCTYIYRWNCAATAILGLGQDGDSNISEISHVGWVKKTVGTGGRAGRVHYETLVENSSISGDAEDIATPDS